MRGRTPWPVLELLQDLDPRCGHRWCPHELRAARRNRWRHPRDYSPAPEHPRRRVSGDRYSPGAPGHLPRREHPRGPGPVLPAQHLPQPTHRVGGDDIRRHRDAGSHTKHIYFDGRRSGSGSGTTASWPSIPMRTGSPSCGTPRRRSTRPYGPETAGPPTTCQV